MVQKSGYFSRASAAGAEDLRLIKSMPDYAVQCALEGKPGLIGHDEENGDLLSAIAFARIKGGKAFDINTPWFQEMMADLGQEVKPA